MPVRLRPNVIVDATLYCEEAKPIEDRINWQLRVLTAGEELEFIEARKKALKTLAEDEIESLLGLVKRIAVGWSNLVDADGKPVPFNDEGLEGFTRNELWAIVNDLRAAMLLGDQDKKKSPSQSPSAAAAMPAQHSASLDALISITPPIQESDELL